MSLHPLAVHFPIALLSVSAVFYILYAWASRDAYRTVAQYCHVLGLVGALVAVLSGVAERARIEDRVPTAWLDRHQTLGIGTAVYFLMMWVIFLQRPTWMQRRGIVLTLTAVGLGLLGITVWYGTTLRELYLNLNG